MSEDDAVRFARAFAERQGISWLQPVSASKGIFRERGWLFSRCRNIWVVRTRSGLGFGGGGADFYVDENTGAILEHFVYKE